MAPAADFVDPMSHSRNVDSFVIDKKRKLIDRKLRLGDKITSTEMLTVYKGEYNRETVVIKKLSKKGMNDGATVSDLRNEMYIMCELSPHENVVNCISANVTKPDVLLVMEYMKRGSLFEVLYKSRIQMTWAMIRKIALQLATGMAHMHARRFVHRDLKSLNILVDNGYNVKVADFGLSRPAGTTGVCIPDPSEPAGVCGTFQYMAPEVLRGERHSFQSDVFAFAVVLCEMIAGSPPFQGVDGRVVAEKVVNDGARPTIPASCQRPYINLIEKCWATIPKKRPSFPQIIQILDSIK